MALRDQLNGNSFSNDRSKKKKKKIIPTKKKAIKKLKTKSSPVSIIDSKLVEQIEDILRSEPPPSKVKHTNKLEDMCNLLDHQIGEWLKCFVLVGYTDDGKSIEIGHAKTPMDEQALDGLIYQLSAARTAINNVNLKYRINEHFKTDEEY